LGESVHRRTLRHSLAVVAVLAAAWSGACGGNDKPKERASGDTPAVDAANETTTTTASGKSSGSKKKSLATTTTAKPAEGTAAAPAATEAEFLKTQEGLDQKFEETYGDYQFEASIGKQCVAVGGTQSIEIKAPERSAAGFDSYYADGKSGAHPDFYGGNSGANVDKSGVYRATWTIAPNAPPGIVTVRAVVMTPEGQSGHRRFDFRLVGLGKSC
jgi:hypothetical protein